MKIIDFIICDDIRREIGNKHTLVGVYDESIDFSVEKDYYKKWPKGIKLGFFIRIALLTMMPDEFSFNMIFEDKKTEMGRGKIKQDSPISQRLNLIIVHNNFLFQNAGEVKFQIDFFKNGTRIAELIPDSKLLVRESLSK
jgi:hypothetical protein